MFRKRTLLPLLSFCVSACFFATPCLAADVAPRSNRIWYGDEIIAVVAPLDGLTMFAGASSAYSYNIGPIGALAALGFAMGRQLVAPIVHFRHGHLGRGFASLGMHFGLSVAGFFASWVVMDTRACTQGERPYYCGETMGAIGTIGAVSGSVLGTVIDTAGYTYDDASERRSASSRPKGLPCTYNVVPTVTPNSLGLGIAGRF